MLDDPENFKSKEVLQARCAGPHPAAGALPRPLRARSTTWCASTTTRPGATTRRAGTTSTSSAGWVTRCRSRSTSCAVTRSWLHPSCSNLALFMDLAAPRPANSGVQEWLSFYFKAPQGPQATADRGTRPVHPADQAEEHTARVDGRRAGHPLRSGLTGPRVARVATPRGVGHHRPATIDRRMEALTPVDIARADGELAFTSFAAFTTSTSGLQGRVVTGCRPVGDAPRHRRTAPRPRGFGDGRALRCIRKRTRPAPGRPARRGAPRSLAPSRRCRRSRRDVLHPPGESLHTDDPATE